MAGRILPIALATVAGISIGVATFDREFKERRRIRLEEEYNQEIASIASKETIATSLDGTSPAEILGARSVHSEADIKTGASVASKSSWSSLLGFLTWNKSRKEEISQDRSSSEVQKPV